jgi:thiamine-phosphate pyrophosphorylase
VILPRLLVITDRMQARSGLEEVVRAAAGAGAWVLFRDKDVPPAERREMALRLRAVTRAAGTPLSISADVELAEDVGANGVHLQRLADVAGARRRLGAKTWIGFSAHGLAEAAEAGAAGVDYATLSPIFSSLSKPGYGPALGVDVFRARTGDIPLLALGGLTPERAGSCIGAGAHGVAVMGGVMAASDPAAEVRKYRRGLG